MMLLDPSPTFPALDQADVAPRRAELRSDSSLRLDAAQCPDLQNVACREYGLAVPLSPAARSMDKRIGHVSGSGLPRQVTLRDARQMTVAAGMRGFMLRGRRFAVRFLADKMGNSLRSTIEVKLAVTTAVSAVRPDQAIGAVIGENLFPVVAKRLSRRGLRVKISARQEIAVSPPSRIMTGAPAARINWLVAIWNRAYSGMSHCGASSASVVRTRSQRSQRSAGSLFLAQKRMKIKEKFK